MSKAFITIEVDEDNGTLRVDREHDPEIPSGTPVAESHQAAMYAAIAYEALDQATESKCLSCAGDAVMNLRQIADALHSGKATIRSMVPGGDPDPTKH